MTCFREVDNALLGDYVRRYESVYDPRVSQYLNAAARCQVGNGDATAAKNSLFPDTLKAVANAEFGFVLGLGKGHVTTSRAYHGYAKTDPDIQGTTGAVEVFDVVNIPGAKLEAQEPEVRDGAPALAFTVSNFDSAEAAKTLRRIYRMPVSVEVRAFEFKYNGVKNVPFEKREDDLNSWQEGIADIVIDAGYREFPESEFERLGLSSDEVRDRIIQNMRFGDRKFTNELLGPKFFMLFHDAPGDCGHLIDLAVELPEKNVKVDYGAIVMVLMDFGHCREHYPDRLINDSVNYIRSEVENR